MVLSKMDNRTAQQLYPSVYLEKFKYRCAVKCTQMLMSVLYAIKNQCIRVQVSFCLFKRWNTTQHLTQRTPATCINMDTVLKKKSTPGSALFIENLKQAKKSCTHAYIPSEKRQFALSCISNMLVLSRSLCVSLLPLKHRRKHEGHAESHNIGDNRIVGLHLPVAESCC